jgi:hypothetical protein
VQYPDREVLKQKDACKVYLIVVSHNYGGAYILSELDGTVLHCPIAAFRLLPYFAHKSIPLPPDFIDIDDTRLCETEHSLVADGDEEDTYQNPRHSHQMKSSYLYLSIYFTVILSFSFI